MRMSRNNSILTSQISLDSSREICGLHTPRGCRSFFLTTGQSLRASVSNSGQRGAALFRQTGMLIGRVPDNHSDVSQPGRGRTVPRCNLHRHQQERVLARRSVVADHSASNHGVFRPERAQRRVPFTVRDPKKKTLFYRFLFPAVIYRGKKNCYLSDVSRETFDRNNPVADRSIVVACMSHGARETLHN